MIPWLLALVIFAVGCAPGGAINISAPVQQPVINSFSVSPPSISAGESATLSWTVTGATTVSIDQGIGSVPAAGTMSASPTKSTTYTLTAINPAGTVTGSVTADVPAASKAPPQPSPTAGTMSAPPQPSPAPSTMPGPKPTSICCTLTVIVSPTAAGKVTLAPPGNEYAPGTVVTLTAVPGSGYKFHGWGGAVLGNSTVISRVIDSNESVIAYFTLSSSVRDLDVSVSPPGTGEVIYSPGDYKCGTVVTLWATPQRGYQFDHWGGAVSGTSATISQSIGSNESIVAYFKQKP